jgi:CoA:oxalate CoA-transferase
MMKKPLEGVRVLDLTRVLAGPFCTMMLLDLGAEIIKVENPKGGDDSRAFGPFQNGKSAYFLTINRGKKSVSLNLKTEKGKEILRELVKHCDVICENYTPGTMEKLGIGYEDLRKINPRIIYAAMSGFGHTGPDRAKPAYDILVQAMGGVMSITGWPGSAPTRVGVSMGDISASLFGAIGITTALYQREKTGVGQKVDVAMLDCQAAMLENALARFQVDKEVPQPLGSRHPSITPFQAYQAQDGYLIIAAGNDVLWSKLCTALCCVHLIADVRFDSNAKRSVNVEAVERELNGILSQKSVSYWMTLLNDAGVPCSPVNGMDAVLKHPQLLARNMFVDVDDPAFPGMKIPGNPIKMSSLPEEQSRAKAPEIGEHNEEVLHDLLGMSAAQIAEVLKSGAF